MKTISYSIQVAEGKFIEKKKPACNEDIKINFVRWVKCYRLAYGKYPSAESIRIKMQDYSGVSLQQLIDWAENQKSAA